MSAPPTAPAGSEPPTAGAPEASARTGQRRAERDFRLFLIGQVASVFGSSLTTSAIAMIAVAGLGASTGQMSIVVVAGTVPALLFGPVAGVLLDRVRRPRRMLITADLVSAAAVGACALGAFTGILTFAWLVALTVVLNAALIVIEALYFSHLNALGVADVAAARGKLQSSELVAQSVAHSLGGPVVAFLGAALLFVGDVLTYLFSAFCLASLKTPDTREPRTTQRQSVRREFVDGIAAIRAHALLSGFVIFAFLSSVAAGGIMAQRAVFLLSDVGLPVALYTLPAVVGTLFGAAGALLAPKLLTKGVDAHTIVVYGAPAAAIASAALPMAGGGLPLILLAVMVSTALPLLFGAAVNIALVGVVNDDVGDEYFARIITLLGSIATLGTTIGGVLGGTLGMALGARSGIWLCVAISVFGSLTIVLMTRRKS